MKLGAVPLRGSEGILSIRAPATLHARPRSKRAGSRSAKAGVMTVKRTSDFILSSDDTSSQKVPSP